ncbi:MAG: hypothetical protein AAGA65_21585 [Actinomycetota bacterium]
MSVGHVARLLEVAGIPTVMIASSIFAGRMVPMSIPRLVLTRQPLGRPLGPPGDAHGQRRVLAEAKRFLETATEGRSVLQLDGP